MERTALRGRLGVVFSEGFNPRPAVSLACPRPVGVASLDDLLVTRLRGEWSAEDILHRLGTCAPAGVAFLRAQALPGRKAPQPRRAEYEVPLSPPQQQAVDRRLADLARQDVWPVERMVSVKGRRGRKARARRTVDLRPLVESVQRQQDTLRWALVPAGEQWARPGELLALVGLDERVDLARVVRTAVAYRDLPPSPPAAAPHCPNVSTMPPGGNENF